MTIENDQDIIRQDNEDNVNNINYPILFQRPIKKSFRSGHSRRLISKSNGHPAVTRLQRNWLSIIYCHDVANTLINSEWKWSLLALSMSFLFTWLVFALVWWMIAANNGDLDNGADDDDGQPLTNKTVCLNGIQSFAGYLLFSIESQSTIGYGNRYITHHCPEAVLVLCVQLLIGSCVCGLLVQCMYEKMHGPPRLPSTVCFSENAVVCQRDGDFCLIFRVRDTNGRYQCNNKINAYLIYQQHGNQHARVLIKNVKLETKGFLIWPIEVVHKINSTSPFWDLSARDLITKRFEIIVSMEGTSLSTSSTSSTTTSYLNSEILWGRRFNTNCIRFDKASEMYIVDHGLFNSTTEIETMPLCSARRLQQVMEDMMALSLSSQTGPASSILSSFTNSPQLSHNVDSGFGSWNVSPVVVHHVPSPSSDTSKEDDEIETVAKNGGKLLGAGEDSKKMVNGCNNLQENRHNEDEMDSLLVSLQKFLKEDNKVKVYDNMPSYYETSL